MLKKYIITNIIFLLFVATYGQEYINLELNAPLSGTFDYKAKEDITLQPGFSYEASPGANLKASIDPMIVLDPATGGIYGGADNGLVGLINGTVDVSPFGAATYEIPLKITPGTGGIMPQLSIVYNSMGSDGLLGTGFSISGLSVITRCASSIENDRLIDGVDFDSYDRFMLDGNRLVAIQGNYGANNTIYRTENNTFSKIISYASTANGPDRFEVYTKSGLIYEYGATTDSKFTAQESSHVIYWLVDKVKDTKGNYYTVTYGQNSDNGEYYPLRIDYTGNASSSPVLQPYASVRFGYVGRNATQNIFVNGTSSKITKLLTDIKVYYNETVVKTYKLNYLTGDIGTCMLQSVTELGMDGEKYNPTKFEWSLNSSFKPVKQIYDRSYYANLYLDKADIVTGDFNGDGRTDFIATPKSNASFTGWRLFLANENGAQCNYVAGGTLLDGFEKLYAGDFNGDGKTDIIQARDFNGYTNYWLQYSTGNGFSGVQSPAVFSTNKEHDVRIGDFNGDGASDFFLFFKNSNQCKIIRSQYFSEAIYPLNYTATRYLPSEKVFDRVELVDFNGDGLTDIMNLDNNGYQLLESDGWGTMSTTRNETWPDKKHHLNFGDFNGDGKTDMLITGWDSYDWSNWQVRFSTGIGFETKTFSKKFTSSEKQIFIGDMNGDGRDDFFAVDKNGSTMSKIPLYFSCADGSYFYYKEGASAYPLELWDFYPGDFNGDGRLDYIFKSTKDTWTGYQLYAVTSERDNLLKNITDGLGNTTRFNYKSLTDNSVYTKYTNAVYPVSDVEGAFQVVESIERPNGNGGVHVTKYKYKGAKVHKRGRGFMGFSETYITDAQTGISTKNIYEVEPTKYIMGLKRTETRITAGGYTDKLLSEVDYTNTLKTYENTKVFRYITSGTVEKKYELGSSTAYKQTRTQTTEDGYGNILSMEQDFIDPSSGTVETTIVTNNTYDNDVDKWHLGRLTETSVSKTFEDQPTIVRTSRFEYDPLSGLLTKEIVEPGNSLGFEKVYEHDAFGNITKSTTTADGKSVALRSVYDSKGRFETSTYNALDHKTSKIISPYFGTATSMTGANNLTATSEYDGFGNGTKTIGASGIRTIVAYRWCNGDEGGPANALYYKHTESSSAPPLIEFFDKLGRTVRKITTGFDGKRILVDVEYDDLGRAYRTSEPYFEGETAVWTVIYYDELSRIKKKVLPNSSEINIIYNGLSVTTQNPLGQTDTRTVNQSGLLMTSTDNNGKSITFKYNSAGNIVQSKDPDGHIVQMEYDLLGNRTKLIDPDLGTITSTYNAMGELISETDGKNQTVTLEYDDLGRLVKQTEKEGVSSWVYDTEANGIGKLASATGPNGISQSFKYDNLGRVITQTETIDNISYKTYTAYDVYSRISEVTYPADPSNPAPLVVKNRYNKYSFLEKVANAQNGKVYWTAKKMNARGQLEQFSYGNSLNTTKTYNDLTGLLETVKTPGISESWIQNWSYVFNPIGNLTERKDLKRNLTEDFGYDNLNRLIKTKKNGVNQVTVTYDNIGNILTKSDVGTYNYTTGNPHAVESITTTSGSILGTELQEIKYTSFDKVSDITQGTDFVTFVYGLSHERKQVNTYKNNVLTNQKYYVGNLYEKEKDVSTGEIKETCYIFAAGGAIAIYTHSSMGTNTTNYLHKDHLGSIQCITDEGGARITELSYDAWGNRRDADTWNVYTTLPASIIMARGFTGHEHLDLFDLINMNGRVYDPAIGRFLSPDPIIQSPENIQSYNRYSYCLNNPLSLSDPSGYSWFSDNWRVIAASTVAITVSVLTAGAMSAAGATLVAQAVVAGAAGGFAGGFTGAILSGANFGQAFKSGVVGGLIGAAGGFLSFASGGTTATTAVGQMLEKAGKHAFSNAWLNGITGGNMKHGFITGALSSVGNGFISKNMENVALKVTSSAVLGGTIDEIGGGKFANGAITGAYGMLFNELMHDDDDPRKSAANSGGDGKLILPEGWELVAIGTTSEINLALGPGGVSLEVGEIKYKGKNYGIITTGWAFGWDQSVGINHIRVYADPTNFSVYDLEGKSTQVNASVPLPYYLSASGSVEFPKGVEHYNGKYLLISTGPGVGLYPWGGSVVQGSTRIVADNNPTTYDLLKAKRHTY